MGGNKLIKTQKYKNRELHFWRVAWLFIFPEKNSLDHKNRMKSKPIMINALDNWKSKYFISRHITITKRKYQLMPFPVSPMPFPINIVGKILLQSKLLEKFFNFLISEVQLGNISALQRKRKKDSESVALAGNRTRVNCLEGSYAHHYTTNAGTLCICANLYIYSNFKLLFNLGFNFFFANENIFW